MRKGWVIFFVILVLLLAGATVALLRRGAGENKPAVMPGPGAMMEWSVPVETTAVLRGDLVRTATLNVTFLPQSTVPVIPKVSGTVARVHVKVGDRVRKGDVLFEIEDRQYSLGVKQAEAANRSAKAAVGQAELALANAEEELARAKELYERQMISKQQLDAAGLQYESAKAGYQAAVEGEKQAAIALEMAELQLTYTRVTAEIAGTVAELNVEQGSVCAPGTPAGTVIDHSRMKAKVFVPETQVTLIKPGDTVTLTANAWPGKVFSGRVLTVSPLASQQNRQFPVEIIVDNAGGELSAGMLGSVTLVTAVEKDALLIPAAAVLYDGAQTYAYVVENNRAVRREITVSLEGREQVAVATGLAEGDLVITRGQHQVKDGTLVEVKK
ncbi:MAG: efflux RND transporter periplasmic adaptor subunit [Firmicutes bacterium]|nr:efflux RND transporter periplasmic adaptor subunit [Bacillota bacterium]